MKPVVFVGPSLHGIDKTQFSTCDFAPPAVAGDILKAVCSGRRVIGLIDGGFEAGPAVWHKEIHAALHAGCVVYGASSIGALRAAEMATIGMIGIGKVFEDYQSGRRNSDADVALIYGPKELDWPPLSLPLVDFENTLTELRSINSISAAEFDALSKTGRSLFFKSRSWSAIIETTIQSATRQAELLRLTKKHQPSLKSRDAIYLLRILEKAVPANGTKVPAYIETKFIYELARRLKMK